MYEKQAIRIALHTVYLGGIELFLGYTPYTAFISMVRGRRFSPGDITVQVGKFYDGEDRTEISVFYRLILL